MDRTSGAISCNIDVAISRICPWKSGELRDERLGTSRAQGTLKTFRKLVSRTNFSVSLTKSRAGSNIVNMFLDVSWKVIFFCRYVMNAGGMLPKIEICEQQLVGFFSSCIKLNPLSIISTIVSSCSKICQYLLVCGWCTSVPTDARRNEPIHDSINGMLWRSEEFYDFFSGHVVAIIA